MSHDFTGHQNSRRRLQSQRAGEEGGARRERQRETHARSLLTPAEGSRPVSPSRERVARTAVTAADKSLARGRRITRGRPSA